MCGWEESRRIYIAFNDSGSVRSGNIFLYTFSVTKPTSDVEESVVARVLAALTSLCELGLFRKMRIWELMSANLGFLYHPNSWIRQGTSQSLSVGPGLRCLLSGATAFIASAAQHLPSSDVWGILYPSLRHFLRSDVRSIDEFSLLTALKPPVRRFVLGESYSFL